jgi:hypothetical protein
MHPPGIGPGEVDLGAQQLGALPEAPLGGQQLHRAKLSTCGAGGHAAGHRLELLQKLLRPRTAPSSESNPSGPGQVSQKKSQARWHRRT